MDIHKQCSALKREENAAMISSVITNYSGAIKEEVLAKFRTEFGKENVEMCDSRGLQILIVGKHLTTEEVGRLIGNKHLVGRYFEIDPMFKKDHVARSEYESELVNEADFIVEHFDFVPEIDTFHNGGGLLFVTE